MRGILESLFRLFYGSRIKRFAGIPGPTPTFPLGTILEFRGASPWDVCASYERKYGPVALIWLGSRPVIVLNDPDLIRDVLVTKWEDFYKDEPTKAFQPVLKKTEFNENAAEWKRLRLSEPLAVQG